MKAGVKAFFSRLAIFLNPITWGRRMLPEKIKLAAGMIAQLERRHRIANDAGGGSRQRQLVANARALIGCVPRAEQDYYNDSVVVVCIVVN